MMTYRGIIDNGRLVLEDGTRLPNGTEVDIQLRRRAATKKRRKASGKSTNAVYRIADLAVNDAGPRDLARNLDHYLYGTPKRRVPRKRRVG